MNMRIRLLITWLFVGVSIAQAQTAQRTFVSAGSGSDANNCTRALPCRQFAAAIARTSPGGEVIVLDSGGYGTVSISKAVSIISPAGVFAGVTAFSGDALTVNAGTSDVVVLRGLTLNGLGASSGITCTAAATLHVEGLVISGFGGSGINFSAPGQMIVSDTLVRNCDEVGIFVGAASAGASIDRCRLEKNFDGVRVENGKASATNTVAAGNSNHGFFAFGAGSGNQAALSTRQCMAVHNSHSGFAAGAITGSTATLSVARSVSADNTNSGVFSFTLGGTSTARVSGSNLTGQNIGLEQSGTSTMESAGDNTIRGNLNPTVGTITSFSPM